VFIHNALDAVVVVFSNRGDLDFPTGTRIVTMFLALCELDGPQMCTSDGVFRDLVGREAALHDFCWSVQFDICIAGSRPESKRMLYPCLSPLELSTITLDPLSAALDAVCSAFLKILRLKCYNSKNTRRYYRPLTEYAL
jgi:hypothetical protein